MTISPIARLEEKEPPKPTSAGSNTKSRTSFRTLQVIPLDDMLKIRMWQNFSCLYQTVAEQYPNRVAYWKQKAPLEIQSHVKSTIPKKIRECVILGYIVLKIRDELSITGASVT